MDIWAGGSDDEVATTLKSISAVQPCRTSGVTCQICTAPIDGQRFRNCIPCQKLQASPHSKDLADRVVPLAYAWKGSSQLAHDVHNYKAGRGIASAAAMANLACLVWAFARHHSQCIERAADVNTICVATVPSLRDRSGAELRRLSLLLPTSWHPVHVSAQAQNPDNPRAFEPSYFATQDNALIGGSHVVLLEDTWVTGGHAESAAAALRTADAAQVTILAICRLLDTAWTANRTFATSEHSRPWSAEVCPLSGTACKHSQDSTADPPD